MKKENTILLGVIAGIAIISTVGVQQASAHQLFVLFGHNPASHGHVNDVFLVIGHTNEPAFGQKTGLHDGKHHVEIFLSDDATDLALSDADLMIDKYYFKDAKTYNKAKSVNDATKVELNVPIQEAFGDAGHYIHRQIVNAGIYGYRVHGTIDYFGVGELPVDITAFCKAKGMDDPAKFEVSGGFPKAITFGEFGCPENIGDIKFPKRSDSD